MEVSHIISLENLLEEFCSDISFNNQPSPVFKKSGFPYKLFKHFALCMCVFCLFSFVFVVVGRIQYIAQDRPLRMNPCLSFPSQFAQFPKTVKSVLDVLKALLNYRQGL